MRVLVTGGTGYIGSHTCVELLSAGHDVVVIDNLSNSNAVVLDRVEAITGRCPVFYNLDICNKQDVIRVMRAHFIEAVIHFAAFKAVGESVENPLLYYSNNVAGSISVLNAMAECGIYQFVFSSSATVYGNPHSVPINEKFSLCPTNPYGHAKLMVEQVLRDLAISNSKYSLAILRYFNPIGAHSSGLIGEDPNGIPNNLLPYISQVAVGKLDKLFVFGNDYSTKDGTGVRDYIHVVDLAKGHLAALNYISTHNGIDAWNLGTGVGYSVMEVLSAFELASNKLIPFEVVPRRAGDAAECWSDPSKAYLELGWKACLSIKEMMEDGWRWQTKNPNGYSEQ